MKKITALILSLIFSAISFAANNPCSPQQGCTGVSNNYTIAVGGTFLSQGAVTFSGLFPVTMRALSLVDINLPSSGTLLTDAASYTNPAWIASLDASKISTGTLPAARLNGTYSNAISGATQSIATTATSVNNDFFFPVVGASFSGNQTPFVASNAKFNPGTGTLTAPIFLGNLNGNATTATTASAISGGYVSSITGTPQQVNASSSTGNVVLSLPQSIGPGNSPTFNGLSLTSGSTTIETITTTGTGAGTGAQLNLNRLDATNGVSLVCHQNSGLNEWCSGMLNGSPGGWFLRNIQSGGGVNVVDANSTTFNVNPTTTSNSTATGALVVKGGVGIAGNAFVGGNINNPALTASSIVSTDASKNLASIIPAANTVLIANGSGATFFNNTLPSAVQTNITQLGLVQFGLWNATPITAPYINFNSTNLRNSTGSLNTIQDIASTSSPVFTGLNLSGLSASSLVGTDATKNLASVTVTGDVGITGLTSTITNNAVTNAKLRQSSALSLVGNATNATANVADITAANDGQVMRRSGTTIGFGATNLASGNAVTGVLPNASTTAASANTASAIVARDVSGNFSANSPTFNSATVGTSALTGTNSAFSFGNALADGNYFQLGGSGVNGIGSRNIGVYFNGASFYANNLYYDKAIPGFRYGTTGAATNILLGNTTGTNPGLGCLQYANSGAVNTPATMLNALCWDGNGVQVPSLAPNSIVTVDGSNRLSTSAASVQAYTPTIGDGINNFTASSAIGKYYQIGNLIFVSVDISWTSKGSAGSGTAIKVTLPSVVGASWPAAAGSIGQTIGLGFTGNNLSMNANAGLSAMSFHGTSTNGNTNPVIVSQANNTGQVKFTAIYPIN